MRGILNLLSININILDIFKKNVNDLFDLDNSKILLILNNMERVLDFEKDIPLSTFKNMLSDIANLDFEDEESKIEEKIENIISNYLLNHSDSIYSEYNDYQ